MHAMLLLPIRYEAGASGCELVTRNVFYLFYEYRLTDAIRQRHQPIANRKNVDVNRDRI